MKLNAALGALVATALAIAAVQLAAASGSQYLVPGYYNTKNCSRVEPIVREEVFKALNASRSNGAALVRLFFHDCWVYGCDGSVLLDASAMNPEPEKKADASIGLRGFDVIKTIKDRLESTYPGVVSCADILAFAARDAASYLSVGHIDYAVPSGRLDGVVSRARDAQATLPDSTSSFGDLAKNFGDKKFTVEELVVLSGAHSVGGAHLSSYQDRLEPDSTPIDSDYQAALNKSTPPALLKSGKNPTVPNNVRDGTDAFQKDAAYDPVAMGVNPKRGVLDNSYYHNNLVNKVLFKSDWVLRTDRFATSKLDEYKNNPAEWNSDFADAMVKLSKLPAEGNHFEIRKKCSATNKQRYYYY